MKKDYFVLALGNLRHRGLRSWLTILGIFIGIAAVVSLISLGNGLQQAITGQFNTLSADRLIVQNAGTGFGPPGAGAIKPLTDHDVDIIKSIPGTTNVIPRMLKIAKLEFNNAAIYSYTGSMPNNQKEIDYIYESFSIKADSGRLLNAGDNGKVVIGSDIATDPALGKTIRAGNSITLQGKKFEVVGVLKKASSFQINLAIFMLDDDMKDLYNLNDQYDFIVLQVQDKNKAEEIANDISTKLRKDRNEKLGEEDFSIQTPAQALNSVNLILNIINIIIGGIAGISLFVGGIGIANTMFTSVIERTKEIGTMKAVGAKNSDILYIFLIESGLLGLVGGIIGAIIGLTLAFAVSSIANAAFGTIILEMSISWPLIIAAITFSFVVGVGSGILPAIQASKLKPTQALRK